MSTAFLLVPDFCLILLGVVLRRGLAWADPFWSGLERLVYYILFPALLVHALVRTRIDLAEAAPLILTGLATMGVGMAFAALLRRWRGVSPILFASIFQCAYRFNSYIGLAVAGLLFGQPGIAAMGLVIGTAVPVANLASVWVLARHGESGLWREIGRNPLIWATAVGLLLNLAGGVPPVPVLAFLARLADASIALGLITVGAALRLQSTPNIHSATAYLGLVKLVALPGAALLIGGGLGLGDVYLATVVIFAALPTASSAYILTVRMGGDGGAVAWIISATTLASMLTLPLWVAWLA